MDDREIETYYNPKLAGKPAPHELLVNIPRLVSAYYTRRPDVNDPAQQMAFGTSGHRGNSLKNSFNEAHILAIAQALSEYRTSQGIRVPCFSAWIPMPCLKPPS